MSELLQLLRWDTEFFGLKIGRVLPRRLDMASLEAVIKLAKERRFECLYFQAEPDDDTVNLAEKAGFHLVDVRIVLEHPFDRRPAPVPRYPIPDEIELMGPRRKDVSRLEEIAVEIGNTSRFRFDRGFPPDACTRLYQAWLHKAIADDRDSVIVAQLSGSVVGLIASGVVANQVGNIQLAGVQSIGGVVGWAQPWCKVPSIGFARKVWIVPKLLLKRGTSQHNVCISRWASSLVE